MKLHLKLTSVLLSAVMCASMVMAPVSVIADETSAPEETQTTEASEKEETKENEKKPPKATEKPEPKETEPEEKKPSESKETEPEETKPSETVKETDPTETEDKKPAQTEETEDSKPEETKPSDVKKEEPAEASETEPAQTTNPDEEDVPETTVNPEAGAMDETHSVPPKAAGGYKEGDISGTTGSGTSESDPVICDNFAEFKAAMENTIIQFVKLNGVSGGDDIPRQTTLAPAIEQTTHKTLIITGDNTFFAPWNGDNDCLIFSTNDLVIKGTGTLKYKHGNRGGRGSVICKYSGLLQIDSGVFLSGSSNGNGFGRALSIEGGVTTISNGVFGGYSASPDTYNIDAVCVSGGKVTITGGLYSSSKHSNCPDDKKALGIVISGGDIKLRGGTYHGIEIIGSSFSGLSKLLDSGYAYKKSDKSVFDGSTVKTTLEILTVTFDEISILSVSVLIDAPSVGAKPDYTAVFPSDANYYSDSRNVSYARNDMYWYDITADADINPNSGVFEAGHQYRVRLFLTPKEGYTFSGSTTATLNGKGAEVSMNLNKLVVTYTFQALSATTINSVSITIDAPVSGAKPDYSAVFPSGVKYYSDAYNGGNYRNDICWKDNTTNSYMNPENDVFKAGHQYFVAVYLTAKDGYEFSYDTTATVNGQNADIEMDGDQLVVKYTFETTISANTLSVKPKTAKVKYKKLRKKKQTVARSKVMTVSNPQGNVKYSLVTVKRGKSKKYKKYFKINATTGNVSIKKKLRKGTYKITCKVTAGGNESYKSATKTVTFKIKVK